MLRLFFVWVLGLLSLGSWMSVIGSVRTKIPAQGWNDVNSGAGVTETFSLERLKDVGWNGESKWAGMTPLISVAPLRHAGSHKAAIQHLRSEHTSNLTYFPSRQSSTNLTV
ncbi:hypothetical protein BCT86_15875 [Vibrio breoganii]|uniref:hypothetical protein n=1 Tax=Vibrio breoganii TaxID=553239 RepID=UPI000C8663FA|nr:hypothetical protein [Vibrio breoganii]PML04092.1 hypothetical protein BCT86_15875 [Vibrio breoganii]